MNLGKAIVGGALGAGKGYFDGKLRENARNNADDMLAAETERKAALLAQRDKMQSTYKRQEDVVKHGQDMDLESARGTNDLAVADSRGKSALAVAKERNKNSGAPSESGFSEKDKMGFQEDINKYYTLAKNRAEDNLEEFTQTITEFALENFPRRAAALGYGSVNEETPDPENKSSVNALMSKVRSTVKQGPATAEPLPGSDMIVKAHGNATALPTKDDIVEPQPLKGTYTEPEDIVKEAKKEAKGINDKGVRDIVSRMGATKDNNLLVREYDILKKRIEELRGK